MATPSADSNESVAWARKVNSRWIVHHGLGQSAEDYLKHLEATDPDRLVKSCERARQMARGNEVGDDPKPWFYAGLFSLATGAEARRFIEHHWFTMHCIPALVEVLPEKMKLDQLGEQTQSKLVKVRDAVEKLDRGE